MSYKIYVCNIPYSLSSEDLKEVFSTCGKVVSATACRDKATDTPLGYGFVEMKTEWGRADAIKALDGRVISGRVLRVEEAVDQPNPDRSRTIKIQGTGTCVVCGKDKVVAGYALEKSVCAACAKVLGNVHYFHNKAQAYSGESTSEQKV